MSKEKCIGCGRKHESDKLAELQDVARQNFKDEPEVGDKVRLNRDHGIEDAGTIGVIGRIKDGMAEVTFNYQTPFSLEMLEKHGSLSISGGTVKRFPVEELQSTTEVERTLIHKTSPSSVGDTPQVTIYSRVWEKGEQK